MRRWGAVVALLYGAALLVLTLPTLMAAFAPKMQVLEAAKVLITWQYWAWLLLMMGAQAVLLVVPVRVASRRPVSRRALAWPALVAGLAAGALVLGAGLSLDEFLHPGHDPVPGSTPPPSPGRLFPEWLPLAIAIATWAIWAVLFWRAGGSVEPSALVGRQMKLLPKGSILELLVAVPTHVVARYRDYCCAGILTFIGIACGISVMLLSFGPAVPILYLERWRRLHPEREAGG